MTLRTLITAPDLHDLVVKGGVLVVDCRADLADKPRAARDYAQAHVSGAVFADLETDLSDLSKTGLGRHPLPDAAAFAAVLGRWGWTPGMPVVAYDDANGALAAARLWWMLRLAGEREIAVLDGGLGAWKSAGLPLESGVVARTPTRVEVAFDPRQIVYTDELCDALKAQRILLLDARAAPRFRGEVEPIDPVAGHVPGARNRPFSDNLESDGRYKPAEKLRAELTALLGSRPPSDLVNMCGSGVTACHNLLAMEHAGLPGSRIYAPSWSGYIADRSRPVER